jgi:hypothetical protein
MIQLDVRGNMNTSIAASVLPRTVGELVDQNDPRLHGIIEKLQGIDRDAICISVIGSTRFWGEKSRPLCEAIGAKISKLNVVLFTGSMTDVQQTVAKSAADSHFDPKRMHHLFPGGEDGKNSAVWKDEAKYGCWHQVGACFEDRRHALARTSRISVLVEGGPGACQEANEVLEAGGIVLPAACTGGAAGGLIYNNESKESKRSVDFSKAEKGMRQLLKEADYNTLRDKNAEVGAVADVIVRAIKNLNGA